MLFRLQWTALSPLDPVPDVIPVVGWTDDLLYIVGIIYQVLQIVKSREASVIEDYNE